MLLFNDEDFEIPTDFKKKFEKDHKGNMIFKLNSSFIYYDSLNEKYRAPASVNIETITPFKNDKGVHGTLRWCDHKTPQSVNGVTFWDYTPNLLGFSQTMKYINVDERNVDLAFFLFVSQDNKNNPSRDKSKNSIYYLENKQKEAEVSAKANRLYADAINLIWGEDISALRDTAKSLMIDNVDEMGDEEVRNRLDVYVKDKKGIIKKTQNENAAAFFIRKMDGADKAFKVVIQEAIDYDVIKYVQKNRNWVVMEGDGKDVFKGEVLSSVRTGENRVDALVKYFMKEDSNDTLSLVKERVKVKRNKSKVE